MIKKIFIILPLVALTLLSCKKDEEDNDKIFSSSPSKLSFGSDGGKLDFSIYGKNFSWRLDIRPGARDWCSFSETEQIAVKTGVGRTLDIPIYAKPNKTRYPKRDTMDLIEVNGAAPERKVTLELKGIQLTMTTADSVYYVKSEGSVIDIPVTTNYDNYSVVSSSSWIIGQNISDGKISLTFEPNTQMNQRYGEIEFKGAWTDPVKDVTLKLAIVQDGIGSILSDSLALVALYNSTDGANWKEKWNLSNQIKNWYGVSLDSVKTSEGRSLRVTGLNIPNQNLKGTIPSDISHLSYLETFRINNASVSNQNNITGEVLPYIYKLQELEALWISGNGITGTIEASIGDLTKLKSVSITHTSITGAIPDAIAKATKLSNLQLANNNLTGSLPYAIGTLKDLRIFTVNGNRLTGSIPASYKSNLYWYIWGADENVRPQQNGVILN